MSTSARKLTAKPRAGAAGAKPAARRARAAAGRRSAPGRRRVTTKRVYDPPEAADGARILVDRVWPRGLTKAAAALDAWLKDIAPSTPLRHWFGHRPERWDEFRQRYAVELGNNPAALLALRRWLDEGPVTLLFGARDRDRNNAVALKDYLQSHVR